MIKYRLVVRNIVHLLWEINKNCYMWKAKKIFCNLQTRIYFDFSQYKMFTLCILFTTLATKT